MRVSKSVERRLGAPEKLASPQVLLSLSLLHSSALESSQRQIQHFSAGGDFVSSEREIVGKLEEIEKDKTAAKSHSRTYISLPSE